MHRIKHQRAVIVRREPVIREYGVRCIRFFGVIHCDHVYPAVSQKLYECVGLLQGRLRDACIPALLLEGVACGRLLVDGIKQKDTPMILGCLIVTTIIFSVVNLFVDILYAFIDPRIKAEYK